MSNRFELEQQILDLWKITDELEMVYERVMNRGMTTDEVANLLLGMVSLYNLKFDRCFTTFEDCVSKKEL